MIITVDGLIIGAAMILVGAPRSNDTAFPDVQRPGALFACTTSQMDWTCTKLDIDSSSGNLVRKKEAWLGGTIEVSTSNIVVTCAHKSDNWRDEILDGVCYEFALEDIPSISFGFEEYRGISNPSAGYGVGISAHYTENANNLLIGTAGFPLFNGGYLAVEGQLFSLNRQSPKHMKYDKYWALLGYSSTSGKYFADGQTYFAFGAPREELKGRVVFFKSGQQEYKVDSSTIVLEGFDSDGQSTPYYSYYGAVLCTVDVNNDNIDDILVGAPLYTPTINDTFIHDSDIGRVYVYLGSDTIMGFKSPPQTLKGIHPQGRFGSAIAKLGDVNSDNFADIAIGAPYENNFQGAVYIYNGYIGGVWSRHSQRIRSSDLDTGLRGFGISITSGKDVNSDGINDMVVGSYLSDQAVMMFAQPHIVVDATLKVVNTTGFPTTFIEVDNDKKDEVFVCFVFYDRRCDYIRLNIDISLDVEKGEQTRLKFSKNNEASMTSSLQVTRGNMECTREIMTKKSTNDLVSEIVIQVDYAVDKMNCPGLNIEATVRRFHASNARDPILRLRENFQFRKDCLGIVCRTDLSLTGVAKYDNISGHYLSRNTELAVDITIAKFGDAAYGTVFDMVYPKYIYFIKMEYLHEDFQISCFPGDSDYNNTRITYTEKESALYCLLGNLISNVTSVRFRLILQATKYNVNMNTELQMLVTTISTDLNPMDNNKTLSINLQRDPDASFNAIAVPKLITLEGHKKIYKMKNVYEVYNKGGSLVLATVNISYPQIQQGDEALLFLNQTKIHCGHQCYADCRLVEEHTTPIVYSFLNGQPVSKTQTPVTSLSHIINIDCTQQPCSLFTCTLRNIQPKSIAYIYMEFIIDTEIETIFKDDESVELISTASIEINQGNILTKQVSTILRKQLMSPLKEEVPWWIIVVSFLFGILLLSSMILVLWKVGFFKRKLRDELVKRKAQIPHSGQVTGKMPVSNSRQVSGKRFTDVAGQVMGRKPTADAGKVSGRCPRIDGGQVIGSTADAKTIGQVAGRKC